MTRTVMNLIIDLTSFVAMTGMVATGLIMRFILPPGSGGRGSGGASLWGLTRHDWGDWHFWLALAVVVAIVLHVTLHWVWICAVLSRKLFFWRSRTAPPNRRVQRVAGVAFGLMIALMAAGFLWVADREVAGDVPRLDSSHDNPSNARTDDGLEGGAPRRRGQTGG